MRPIALALVLATAYSVTLHAQQVRLSKVGLGMTEPELKKALVGSSPRYTERPAGADGLRSLLAVTEEESFLFSFADDKVAAFSLIHLIPPGQQPFLPPGQEPTVKVLRDLVIKQTWAPISLTRGNTFWLSDATGAPLMDTKECPVSAMTGWKLFTGVTVQARSSVGLMKPVAENYPAACGMSIHLKVSPASTDEDHVTKVEIQVLDFKAVSSVSQRK